MSFHDPCKLRIIISGIDSNGKVGSIARGSVGPAEPDEENMNGFALRSVMGSANSVLLNTNVGAGPTWTGSRGHESRIDFVAVTQWLHQSAMDVHVDTSLTWQQT